jgi:sec-independent protein translocase protein TatA
MNIFGIGLPEMAVIAAIGLLVFGPKRLPELGKTLGRTLRGFQSASQEFEKEFRTAITPDDGSEVVAPQALPAQDAVSSAPAVTVTSTPLSVGVSVESAEAPSADQPHG